MEWETNRAEHLTAWDLAGDWWYVYEGYQIRIKGGRALYETASATVNGYVRLSRVVELRQINRYVFHDTLIELVRLPLTPPR